MWSGKRKSKRGLPKPLSSQDDCSRPKGETHEELHLQYSTKIIHPVTEQIRKITIANLGWHRQYPVLMYYLKCPASKKKKKTKLCEETGKNDLYTGGKAGSGNCL